MGAFNPGGQGGGDPCDPLSVSYDPTACGATNPFGDIFGPIAGKGAVPEIIVVHPSPLYVQIPQTLSIVNDIGSTVTDAIDAAFNAQTNTISHILGDLNNNIVSTIDGLSNKLGTFVTNAFAGIGDTIGRLLGSIGTVIANSVGSIFNGVTSVLKDIWGVLGDIGQAIRDKFDKLIQEIHANGAGAIIPVIQLIATEAYNIRNIIAAIQTDLHGGMQALILLPTQIASSLGSLDATFNRAIQVLMTPPGLATQSTVKFPNDVVSPDLAQTVKNYIEGPGGYTTTTDLLSDINLLVGQCKHIDVQTALFKLGQYIEKLPEWIKWLPLLPIELLSIGSALAAYFAKQVELTEEDVNKSCPITKLDVGAAIDAWLRKFISDGTLEEELKVKGYDTQHITVLKQLAAYRPDAGSLIDGWYRGIIDDTTLTSGLQALGFGDTQIARTKASSKALPSLVDVLRWKDYGAVDDATARALMSVLRLAPEQQDLVLETYKLRETTQQQIQLDGRLRAFGIGYVQQTVSPDTPQTVLDAAARDQITPGNARLQWLAHFQLPSYAVIIQSYFRNLRGLNDVQSAMLAENIPVEFWDELVKINRPLIPFRSLPGYVKAGVMSEGDAIVELSSHGFDPLHIKWILDYAGKSSTKTNAGAVAAVASLSIQTARTLFNDGVISQDQYVQVLVAHKYPADLALLQAEADSMAAHAKQRKQEIVDLVDEVLAGSTTVDTALSSLHSQGFSAAEIARFQKGVRTASKTNVKHPSIAELKGFLKAQLITLDQYRTELQLQGWSDPWLGAFVALETPPTP